MKRHTKKAAVLLLSLCLAAGAFSGCTDNNENNNANSSPGSSPSASPSASSSVSPSAGDSTDTKIVDKPITLKVLTTSEAGITLSADTPVFKELSERTNINFEIEELPLAEPAQKLNLIMASKQLPDLLANPGQGKTWFDKYGEMCIRDRHNKTNCVDSVKSKKRMWHLSKMESIKNERGNSNGGTIVWYRRLGGIYH